MQAMSSKILLVFLVMFIVAMNGMVQAGPIYGTNGNTSFALQTDEIVICSFSIETSTF